MKWINKIKLKIENNNQPPTRELLLKILLKKSIYSTDNQQKQNLQHHRCLHARLYDRECGKKEKKNKTIGDKRREIKEKQNNWQ
jgi:hypothetical protein